jgi:hypothetical protein
MRKSISLVCLALLNLIGCAGTQTVQTSGPAGKQMQLVCEQQALVAKEQYLARIKTPDYSRSFSTAWAGSARSDNGMSVFNSALNACLRHTHHTANRQP